MSLKAYSHFMRLGAGEASSGQDVWEDEVLGEDGWEMGRESWKIGKMEPR
jgi:hypothetical protein